MARQDAKRAGHAVALLVDVATGPHDARHLVGEVHVLHAVVAGAGLRVHQLEQQQLVEVAGDLFVGDRRDVAVDPHHGRCARRHVQVGRPLLLDQLQDRVDSRHERFASVVGSRGMSVGCGSPAGLP